MKLRYSANSPYVRKVVVLAIETGLDSRIERVPTNYRDPECDIARDNPLGKVPALIRDDGRSLIDSPVICEYLDGLHGGAKMIPPEGDARWRVLHLQALADGILDAAILTYNEMNRADGERSPAVAERQRGKMESGFAALDADMSPVEGPLNIGQIALGCTIGWIELRLGPVVMAETYPNLRRWYDAFAARPSMVATAPK